MSTHTLDKQFSKTLFGIVGLAVAFMMAFGTAVSADASGTQSTAQLQAQISSLLQTIQNLQTQLTSLQNGGSTVSGSVDYTFTRDLKVGSKGVGVLKLQQALNADADTRVAATGAGSPGNETQYYGPLTANAVTRFQEKYAQSVLFPLGLTHGTGYYGPATRAKMNTILSSTANNGGNTGNTGGNTGNNNGSSTSNNGGNSSNDQLNGGEASLTQFSLQSGNTNQVGEGNTANIATAHFDVRNGDIRLNRVDLSFKPDTHNTETKPWYTFQNAKIMYNGNVIGSADLSNQSNWLTTTPDSNGYYKFRVTGLNQIIRQQNNAQLQIEVTAQNGVNGVNNDLAKWGIAIGGSNNGGIRATDASGIEQYLGNDNDVRNFNVVSANSLADFQITSTSNNPHAGTVNVSKNSTTQNQTLLAFKLNASDSNNNLSVDQIPVIVSISGGATTTTVADVVNNYHLNINGQTYGDWNYVANGTLNADANGASTTALVVFNLHRDVTVNAGSEQEVQVVADLNSTGNNAGNYKTGTVITANVKSGSSNQGNTATDVTAAGTNSSIVADGTAVGNDQTLLSEGIYASDATTQAVTSGSNAQSGVFTFNFTVHAYKNDYYIPMDTTAYGIVVDKGSSVSNAATSTVVHAPNADTSGNFYVVHAGGTEQFSVTTSVSPATSSAGLYSAQLNNVKYYTNATTASTTPSSPYTFTPKQDYQTNAVQVNG